MSARGAVMSKTARNAVKLRNGEFREQCFDNSGEKIDVCTSSPDRGFAAQFSLPTTGKKKNSGTQGRVGVASN